MSENVVQRAAALLEGVHGRSMELSGDDVLSPWAMIATRTALVSSVLAPASGAVVPFSSGVVINDLRDALVLLTAPSARDALPIDDLVTARRWLSEVVAETEGLAS